MNVFLFKKKELDYAFIYIDIFKVCLTNITVNYYYVLSNITT